MNKKKLIETLTVIFVLIFIVLFILSIVHAKDIEAYLGANLESYGAGILFLLAFLIELIPNYLSPHIGAINAVFLNISLQTTILFLIFGSIVGSVLGFELGTKYGVRLERSFLSDERIDHIEELLNEKGRWGVSLAAVSPLPYWPIILGSLKFRRKNFWIYGVLPRSLGIVLTSLIVYAF